MEKLSRVNEGEYQIVKKSYESIKKKIPYEVKIGIVLGTGLSSFIKNIKVDSIINFPDVKNLPVATNKMHIGRYVFTKINGVKVVLMDGRIHYYEGYEPKVMARTIRLMKFFGVEKMILTNSSGGINKNYKPGDMMLIKDYISLFVENPLIGKNVSELGEKFVDMTDPYDKDLRIIVKKVAKKNNIQLKEGVYVQLTGPTFETASEINMLKILGCDAVAMSLVNETIVCRHMGIKVCGISMITNKATGLSTHIQSDKEVLEVATNNSIKLKKLLYKIVPEI